MPIKVKRSKLGKIYDSIGFPIRALFPEQSGIFGFSSLREERMRTVVSFCQGDLLDIGCGPGNIFVNHFIDSGKGLGIDVYPYDDVETVIEDIANLPFSDCTFETVTLIAVGGHIPRSKRVAEFKEILSYLKTPPLKLIMKKRFMWGLNNIYVAQKQTSVQR